MTAVQGVHEFLFEYLKTIRQAPTWRIRPTEI